jgi:glutamine amidotransferase
MIGIIDYGMANLRSVQKAFETVGVRADIISTPQQIERADRIVLPGVGAFADAVRTLREKELAGPMLFDVGYEDGEHQGLGVLKGSCARFDVDETMGLKVPHMGWNHLDVKRPSPLFRDLPAGSAVYFVHGYHVVPDDPNVIATTTDYGRPFVSSVWRDNVMATQFHPEKSQRVGLKILSNFAAL